MSRTLSTQEKARRLLAGKRTTIMGRTDTAELLQSYIRGRIKINPRTQCWEWMLGSNPAGYGRCRVLGRAHMVHRLSYSAFNGEIPEGLVIDHLCKNPKCVNPSHLETVTNRENTLRGESPIGRTMRTNSCRRGHPYTADSTHIDRDGSRRCLVCKRNYKRPHRALLKDGGVK